MTDWRGELTPDETAALEADRAADREVPAWRRPADAAPAVEEPAAPPVEPPPDVGALAEARADREAAERRVAQAAQTLTTLAQRFAPPPPAEEPLPDVDTDPIGHVSALLRRQDAELAALRTAEAQRAQAEQATRVLGALTQHATAAEQRFAAQNPDYAVALAHLHATEHAELEALGVRDPRLRDQEIRRRALTVAAHAAQTGQDPAAIIYGMAKARGYRPASSPAPEAAPRAPARTPRTATSAAALAAGSDADFLRAYDAMTDAQIKEIFGA